MTENFEDRLLATLKEEVASRTDHVTERPRRLVTPTRVGVVLATAAAACGAAVLLPEDGGGPERAYAVERTEDGVRVRWLDKRALDPDALKKLAEELREAGVNSIIDPPEGYLCQPYKKGQGPRRAQMPAGEQSSAEGRAAETTEDGGVRPGDEEKFAEKGRNLDLVGGATTVLDEMIERTGGRPLEDTERAPLPHPDDDELPSSAVLRLLPHSVLLKKGDTMLARLEGYKHVHYLEFVNGPCQPVPGADQPAD